MKPQLTEGSFTLDAVLYDTVRCGAAPQVRCGAAPQRNAPRPV